MRWGLLHLNSMLAVALLCVLVLPMRFGLATDDRSSLHEKDFTRREMSNFDSRRAGSPGDGINIKQEVEEESVLRWVLSNMCYVT